MKIKHIISVIIILFILIYIQLFRIKLNETVYEVDELSINDELIIPPSYLFLSQNFEGVFESIFLTKEDSTFDYIYVRFAPKWYNRFIAEKVKETQNYPTGLLEKASKIHDNFFGRYMHATIFGIHFPINNEKVILGFKNLLDKNEREQIEINMQFEDEVSM